MNYFSLISITERAHGSRSHNFGWSYTVQSYIIFRAKLKKPQFAPGAESLECALFNLDEIPFEALAFSSIFVTLKMVSFWLK